MENNNELKKDLVRYLEIGAIFTGATLISNLIDPSPSVIKDVAEITIGFALYNKFLHNAENKIKISAFTLLGGIALGVIGNRVLPVNEIENLKSLISGPIQTAGFVGIGFGTYDLLSDKFRDLKEKIDNKINKKDIKNII